ncbi:MAG: metallophosphoesterase, partial [Maribacter sp.]|nr:metallophosphoesterase [Maribacter sp.]
MSDVHLQDIYATFSDTDYKGVKNPLTGEFNIIRTMEAQLHSTRLFNENYFAFLAALEDAAQKGIRIIALPG